MNRWQKLDGISVDFGFKDRQMFRIVMIWRLAIDQDWEKKHVWEAEYSVIDGYPLTQYMKLMYIFLPQRSVTQMLKRDIVHALYRS